MRNLTSKIVIKILMVDFSRVLDEVDYLNVCGLSLRILILNPLTGPTTKKNNWILHIKIAV